jgi:hypothetical protein
MAALYGASRAVPFPQEFDQDLAEPSGLPAAAIPQYEPERPMPAYGSSFLESLTEPRVLAPSYVEDERQPEPKAPQGFRVPSFMARPLGQSAPSLIRPYDDQAPKPRESPSSLLTGEVQPADRFRAGSDFDQPEPQPPSPRTPPKTAAPISGVSSNNWFASDQRFDKDEWRPVRAEGDKDVDIVTSDRIAVRVTGDALVPRNQIRIRVTAIPLDERGEPQASLATPQWFRPVDYGATAGAYLSGTNILGATSSAPRHRWIISIPPQQATHGNANPNLIQVFVPRE